jgi:hypothetical protein
MIQVHDPLMARALGAIESLRKHEIVWTAIDTIEMEI